jgi:tripeptidyl-peptidase-1
VSDPAHERYGQHLSKQQLEDLLSSDETVACQTDVEAWLQSVMAPTRMLRMGVDGIHVTAAHADIESAFGLAEPLQPHQRNTGGAIAYRSAAAMLQMPANIMSCVDVVSGVLLSELPEVSTVTTAIGEKATTWPAVLAKLYGLSASVPKGTTSRQATANFIGQYYAQSDLDGFFAKYAPGLVGHDTPSLVGPGINDPTNPGSEASLDLQYIMSAATEAIPTEFWSAPASEQLFPWIQHVNAAKDPPQVFSMSYGGGETSDQAAYLTRFNVELQKAGTRGISVMVSAGDGGVGCSMNSPGGKEAFQADYPASFPAITTVGGTTNPDAETVWKQGGGGFSNVFARPKYQTDAVNEYLANGAGATLPPPAYFNASGRAYPDVTAMSTGFVVYQGGTLHVPSSPSINTTLPIVLPYCPN